MSFDIGQLRFDDGKQTEGVWVDYAMGLEFLVARWNNPKHRELKRKQAEEIANRARRSNQDSDVEALLLAQVCETICNGWRGMDDASGPIEWSRETSYKILSEIEEFREFVIDQSNSFGNYRATEEDAKN